MARAYIKRINVVVTADTVCSKYEYQQGMQYELQQETH
jgi:hypothetical protein